MTCARQLPAIPHRYDGTLSRHKGSIPTKEGPHHQVRPFFTSRSRFRARYCPHRNPTYPDPYTRWDPFLVLLAEFPDDFEVAAKICTD